MFLLVMIIHRGIRTIPAQWQAMQVLLHIRTHREKPKTARALMQIHRIWGMEDSDQETEAEQQVWISATGSKFSQQTRLWEHESF